MHATVLTPAVAVSRVLAITTQLVGYWSSNNARIDLVLRPCHAGARDSSHDDKAVNVTGNGVLKVCLVIQFYQLADHVRQSLKAKENKYKKLSRQMKEILDLKNANDPRIV